MSVLGIVHRDATVRDMCVALRAECCVVVRCIDIHVQKYRLSSIMNIGLYESSFDYDRYLTF